MKIPNIYAIPNKTYGYNDLIYLNEESTKSEQPKDLKIILKDHQKTSLNMIHHLEKKGGFYFVKRKDCSTLKEINVNEVDLNKENIYKYDSSYWILSDKTGYGKTLTSICVLYDKIDSTKINYDFLYSINAVKTPFNESDNIIFNLFSEKLDTYINKIINGNSGNSMNMSSYFPNNIDFLDKSFYKKLKKVLFKNISLNKNAKISNTINFDQYVNRYIGKNMVTFNNFIDYEDTFNDVFNFTLIVVPFGKVFKQWKSSINDYTSLKGLSIINTAKDLEKEIKFEATFMKPFIDFISKYKVNTNSESLKNDFDSRLDYFTSSTFSNSVYANSNNLCYNLKYMLSSFSNDTVLEDINNLKNITINYKKFIDSLDYILIGNTFACHLFNILIYKYKRIVKLINYLYTKYYIDNIFNEYMEKSTVYKNYINNANINQTNKDKLLDTIQNSSNYFSGLDETYNTRIYRIIIDEADSINLSSKYSFTVTGNYVKLGFITATYNKLLNSRNNYVSLIESRQHGDNISTIIPIISNDEEFLKKSFQMPTIFKKYYKCIMNNNLENVNYLVNNNLISKNVLEMINVGDYENAIKEAGGDVTQDDTIIDSITKDLYKKIHNKKIEREMISKLDMTENAKTSKIESINKDIKIYEEKIKDVNNKFKDVEIFDKIASKYGEDFLLKLDEVQNDFFSSLESVEFEIKIKELFKNYNGNMNSNNEQNNIDKESDLFADKLINIFRSEDKNCGICSSFYRKPMVLECNHIFCSKCIITWIKSGTNKKFCPLCKKSINLKNVKIIADSCESKKKDKITDDEKIDIKNPEELFAHYFKPLIGNNENEVNVNNTNVNVNDSISSTSSKSKKGTKSKVTKTTKNEDKSEITISKYDAKEDKPNTVLNLLTYLNMFKDKKIIVFSNYDSISEKIINAINNKRYDFKVEFPKGQGSENAIDRFREGSSNLLFLNSKHNGAGIEIPEGTDIIILHKMDKALDTQVIGRCMRLGRTKPLDVHYILHGNEMSNI